MEKEKIDISTKSKTEKEYKVVLHNDNVNTFEYVIMLLLLVCGHSMEQAEQCALMVHNVGKCSVKTGTMDDVLPIAEALDKAGLHIQIV